MEEKKSGYDQWPYGDDGMHPVGDDDDYIWVEDRPLPLVPVAQPDGAAIF